MHATLNQFTPEILLQNAKANNIIANILGKISFSLYHKTGLREVQVPVH